MSRFSLVFQELYFLPWIKWNVSLVKNLCRGAYDLEGWHSIFSKSSKVGSRVKPSLWDITTDKSTWQKANSFTIVLHSVSPHRAVTYSKTNTFQDLIRSCKLNTVIEEVPAQKEARYLIMSVRKWRSASYIVPCLSIHSEWVQSSFRIFQSCLQSELAHQILIKPS